MADGFLERGGRCNIDLLVGNDYYDDIIKSEKIEIDHDLHLINSALGWIFPGRVMHNRNENTELSMLVENVSDLSNFWKLETIGLNNLQDDDDKQWWNN